MALEIGGEYPPTDSDHTEATMAEPAFDTLTYFNNLKRAGVPEGQVQAQTEAMVLVASSLATKDDIIRRC